MERTLSGTPVPAETQLKDISGLIPKHVRTRESLDRAEFENITAISRKYFLSVPSRKKAPFTFKWFSALHREMFGEVWEWAGQIRTTDVGIGCAPSKIGAELHKLIYDLGLWEKEKKDAFEIAVRLHHRLVWIHPFNGGNGRWARTAANIYLAQSGLLLFEWPEDRIKIEGRIRKEYVEALRNADHGDIHPLLRFHKRYWKEKR
ncbi:MAG: mobile mystery protein B [Candidatus Omnitrophica bacterium]|nr:mobile mystery protein B [Candidatus Omnitrophota bacterium]